MAFLGMWGVRTCLLDDDRPILRTPPLADCSPVAVAPTGELVAGVAGNELRVWNLRVQAPVAVHALNGRILDVLAFSPDARTLAVAWRDRAVQLCDPLRGFGESFDFGTGRAESMAFAPDGLTLAVAGVNGLVVVDVG